MTFTLKSFDKLTTQELYEILQARMAVFVVEQNCPYQDIDGQDYNADHLFIKEDGKLKAYLRILKKDEDTARLGRIITTERGKGYGLALIKEGIRSAAKLYKAKKIYIEAQCQAVGFYEKVGFKTRSEPFLDDGIPHVKMELYL